MTTFVPNTTSLHIGKSFKFTISVVDIKGLAVDISSANVTWKLALREGSAAVLSKTEISGISVINGPGGLFEVNITTTDSTALTRHVYYWESSVKLGADDQIVAFGHISVKPLVT